MSPFCIVYRTGNFFSLEKKREFFFFFLEKLIYSMHFVTNILITIGQHGNNKSKIRQKKKNNNIRLNELSSVSFKFIVAISTNNSSIDWLMPSKGSHFDNIKSFHHHDLF